MANELARMMKNKRDAELRLQNQNQKPVVIENTDGSYYAPEQSDYTAQLAQGKNITITTSSNIKTITAIMNLLEGSNISVSAPDENGAVTITGTIGGKEIDLTGLTDGYVLTYDGVNDKFIVSEVSGSYALPQATETDLGGIKAKAKTTESSEIAIDTATGKLYGPAPDAAANGLPSGGTTGQIPIKVDGTDYNAAWGDLGASDIAITDTAGNYTATDVEGALSELFTSVSDGKTLIAAAITDKGVSTSATDSFATMATNIGSISGGSAPSEIRYKSHVPPVYTAGATSVSVTIPSDTVEGDLLIVCLFARSTVTAPSGWIQAIKQSIYTANVQWLEVYYKIASSTDAGATLTFTQATSARMAVSLIVATCPTSGVAIDDFAGANSSTKVAIPSVTSEGSGRLCIIAHTAYYSISSGPAQYYLIGNKWIMINDPYFDLNRIAISICHLGSGARPSATLQTYSSISDTAAVAVIFQPI